MTDDDILNAAIHGELLGYMCKSNSGELLFDYEFMEWQGDTYLVSYDVDKNILDTSRKIDNTEFMAFLFKPEFIPYSAVKRRNYWTERGTSQRNAEIARLWRI